jgi:DNA polymerase III subunit beta
MTVISDIEMEKIADQTAFATNQKTSITVKTDVLKKVLLRVAGAFDPKSTIEALKGIYFFATSDKIEIKAANGNFYIETSLPKEEFILDGENGGLIFPGKKFVEIVGKLSGKNTTIEIDGTMSTIKSKSAKLTLAGMHPDMFPKFPTVKKETTFELPAGALLHLYNNTVFATAKNESAPILTGVSHQIKNKRFRCVSTDRHRLCMFYYEQSVDVEDASSTIPASSVAEVMKHLKKATMVKVSIDHAHIVYDMGDIIMYSRVLEGTYPDVDRLIPPEPHTVMQLNADDLRAIFRRVAIYADENGASVATFKIKPEEKQLRILSLKSEYGQLQEDVNIVAGRGNDIVISANIRYLVDVFARIPTSGQIAFNFTQTPNGHAPFLIRPLNGDEGNLYLIVPVRQSTDVPNENIPDAKVEIEDFNPSPVEYDPFEDRINSYTEEFEEEVA